MTNLGTIYLVDKELLSLHCKLYIIELNQQKKHIKIHVGFSRRG